MDSLAPLGLLSALTEVSARMSEAHEVGAGAGVIALFVKPDASLYRLSLEHERSLEREVGKRLAAQLRKQDRAFALERGEWLVVLPRLASTAVLTLAMLRFEQAFNEAALQLDGLELQLDVVCGAAISPDHGEDALHLLQSARIACLAACQAAGGSLIYDKAMERTSPRLAALESELRRVFTGDNPLELHLQPKVRVNSGRCHSAEALLRWRRASGERVSPAAVIASIDRLGMRHAFNRWLFHTAAKSLHALDAEGLDVMLSINLSATDLYDAEVPELIAQALATWNVRANLLRLEITETSMLEENQGGGVADVLKRLLQLGVTLSIDDFGTGFSGMSRLQRLPVQEVKIDRSFVVDIASSPRDREIAGSIIDLSHRLGIEVVAEGVENAEAAAVLGELGCDYLQGYLFGRAMALGAFVDWVRARNAIEAAASGGERRA